MSTLVETDYDYIHILVGYDTTERVCDIVRYIKQATTYQLWLRYKDVLARYYWGYRCMLWSDGYFACSVGNASADTIRQYIAGFPPTS